MACEKCKERRKKARQALLDGKMIEATKHVAIGAAEMVGIKEKDKPVVKRGFLTKKPKTGEE